MVSLASNPSVQGLAMLRVGSRRTDGPATLPAHGIVPRPHSINAPVSSRLRATSNPTMTAKSVALTEAERSLRVLMAPMNFADQPMSLVRALRRRGVHARQIQYTATGRHPMGYELDRIAALKTADFHGQFQVLAESLREGFDVFHFWQRSLLFRRDLRGLTALDLPFIKAHGANIFHRFTGFDLRMPTLDRASNQFSPYNYGFVSPFDERAQLEYIEMLREYVDLFLVQDPEMHQYMPEARIIPRGLQVADWEPVGVEANDCPLVVHAPSNAAVKGSNFIIEALASLKHEGLRFEFKLLGRIPHEEAKAWYRKADIIIDQIMIGATGVLTLEAWALAKPCITYLRPDLFEPFYNTRELPVANANPNSIKTVLRKLVKDFDWRCDLSARGRRLLEEYHDIDKIAEEYETLCREFGERSSSPEKATANIDFFTPRIGEVVAPRFPPPAVRRGPNSLVNKLARVERTIYGFENRMFRLLLRYQAYVFRLFAAIAIRLRPGPK